MNKRELVHRIASKTGFTQKDTQMTIDAAIQTIEEALKKGDEVKIIGFGTLRTIRKKARIGRNPRDPKKTIKIPACNAVTFRAGKSLKYKINGK